MSTLSERPRRWTAAVTTGAVVVSGVLLSSSPAAADDDPLVITGQLNDSTPFRFVVPDEWNGTVFVDLDFAAGTRIEPHVQYLLDQGAAYGGTTRNVTGWNVGAAIDNQVEALDAFAERVGTPTRAIASGRSMGGFVAAGVAQRHPTAFDGVVSMCGGLSGTVSQWNQKLDTVFVLSTLLDPSGQLPVIDIPADVSGAREAWFTRLADAQETPEGRARIALAAAIGQLPAQSQALPNPDATNTADYEAAWYGALAGDPLPYIGQAMGSRRSLEQVTGGNPSWNTGIDYFAQFRGLSNDSRKVVERLYEEAGLSLNADLAQVDGAERIAADPAAVERFSLGTEFDGELSVPVVAMSNTGDQISTVAQQSEYETEVRSAGDNALLRQVYVDSVGHCSFSAAELVVATELLLDRLDSGHWSGGDNATQLNEAAAALELGGGRFITFTPDRFSRPYTLGEPFELAG
ncbi:alpha/beta fold hydrolase [Agromyces sp. NPDC049794]|uniref:alpha/beta hydrolase family protein n=1 Tax=unclassified Agromyces TaxID=2639701 RepID=UPI0033F05AA2